MWGGFYKLLQDAIPIFGFREALLQRSKIHSMTTDERLDRLTERHEVLAESLQLLTADVQSLAQSAREVKEAAKEHDQILRGHANLIGDLGKMATAHEQRLQRSGRPAKLNRAQARPV
jgi:methyl-accepting chemotaxis protein